MRVLLSEGSSLSARHTLYALGPRHSIDVLDPDPLCQARFSRYVQKFHRCPAYGRDPLGYLESLQRLVESGSYDVLVPTHEQVYLIAKHRDQLRKHVGLAVPPFEKVDTLQSKVGFSRLLDELGLPQPPCRILSDLDEISSFEQLPSYIKLPYSTAGLGVHLIENRSALDPLMRRLVDSGAWEQGQELLVQSPAIGVQATAQGVFDQGRLVGFHCFEARALGVGGMSMARVSAAHPRVREHLQRLGEQLDWHGALFLDYFYDGEQGPQYIEANPRIGETVNAMLCGVNLPEMLLRVSVGEQVDVAEAGRVGVRSHSGFMILMAAAMQGARRRRLLRESWDWMAKTDLYSDSEDELTRPTADLLSLIPAAAMAVQLFASPSRANTLVNKAVANYALSDAAVKKIRAMQQP